MVNVELRVYPKFGKVWTKRMPLTDDGVVELQRLKADACKVMVCQLLGTKADDVSMLEVKRMMNDE